jgi:hypothetical protein
MKAILELNHKKKENINLIKANIEYWINFFTTQRFLV